MSTRSFLASSCIQNLFGSVDGAFEKRVFKRTICDEINLAMEDGFQPASKIHESVGDSWLVGIIEFHHKIKVATLQVEIAGDG
jgi:hypothetical protein